ncbi:DNA-binding protein [Planctomycetales bacterium]|nr:DNA-binding protein [Planctomycetales bacterium]
MENHEQWLARAQSNLELAKVEHGATVFNEDLCFQAQQAAEKGLKALLLFYGEEPDKTHNLVTLVQKIATRVAMPTAIKEVVILNNYAVQTRYPGDYTPVTTAEYENAVRVAGDCLQWVKEKLSVAPPDSLFRDDAAEREERSRK